MAKSKNQEYAEKYAEFAKEQMLKYGIPASVTLAQGILESANGESQLAQKENNHFGIKASKSWLNQGGRYGVYTDDRPNEKFCACDSVNDTYEHHSKILANNDRYAQCFKLAPDDYKGWTKELARAGYASGQNYDLKLQQIIERNGLDTYDKQVMAQKGLQVTNQKEMKTDISSVRSVDGVEASHYSFPLVREEFLFVTSPFGTRQDPLNPDNKSLHKGLDIRANNEQLLATEDNGKIISVNHNPQTAGGKSVTIEYARPDNSRMQVTYAHLDKISVKVGDIVEAGQSIGISGNTGTRTTGPHLHFQTKAILSDGTARDIDPAAYLAEIAQKGNINIKALHNGNDLMAKYQEEKSSQAIETSLSPQDWMKKLLSSEDSGTGISRSQDPIMDFVVSAFSSLMMLAVQIDNKSEDEQNKLISEGIDKKEVDLTPLLPNLKNATIKIDDSGKAILMADNGNLSIKHELTSAELSRMSSTLNNEDLTDDSKHIRIAGLVNSIVLSKFASQNFEQAMSKELGQEENIKR